MLVCLQGQEGKPLNARNIWGNSADPNYNLDEVASWCNRQPFKKLKLVKSKYQCISPTGGWGGG